MLSEYKEVRQRDNEGFRQWYSDAYFDLIVWYDREGGAMTGFQLCYDKGESERAFTWKLEENVVRSHRFIVNGQVEIGTNKMSSILKGDAATIDEAVISRLRLSKSALGDALLETIVSRIEDYNRSRAVNTR